MSTVKRLSGRAGFLVALSSCANPSYGGPDGQPDGAIVSAPTTAQGDASRPSGPGEMSQAGGTTDSAARSRDAASDRGPASDAGGISVGAHADVTAPLGPPAQSDAGSDGGSPPPLPAWAAQLPGVYAIRVQEFSVSSGTWVRWLSLGKLEITQSGDQLSALLNTCAITATTQAGTNLGRTDGASKLPARRFEVALEADSFTISPLDIAIGYEGKPPDSCQGHEGQSIMKRSFQTWISGTQCVCGIEALPQANDCRVTDPDSDGRPGYSSSSHALADVTTWGVTESYSRFVQGHVGNDQAHTALFLDDERLNQFGCDPIGACTAVGVPTVCPLEYNRTLFAPLRASTAPSGGWTCAAIEENTGQLFPGAPPPFPTSCTKP